ncbi:MAG: ribosome maturation factor RimM [Pseudomonadota bacterium]|nr:ribosome maturation factor RimM [Pseudomonadota bacterium]
MVIVGHIAGAFGVAGEIRVEAYTETPESLLQFKEWSLRARGEDRPRAVQVVAAKVHGDAVVAKLAGISTRDQALDLKGCEISVPREALPVTSPDEIYWADLAGLQVVNREGHVLGRVKSVTAHGAHPLLAVVADGAAEERLIPYVPAVIDAVDMTAGRIDVDWGEDY